MAGDYDTAFIVRGVPQGRHRSRGTGARGLTGEAFSHLVFLRLAPVFPFWLVNIAPVSMTTHGLAILIGTIPGSFIFVNLETTLGTINHLEDLATPRMGLALGLLATVSLLPVIMKRLQRGGHA